MKKLRSVLLSLCSFVLFTLGFSFPAFAQGGGGPADVIGKVEAPNGVRQYNTLAGSGPEAIGIILFVSNMIKVATIVAGLIVFYNFLMAGFSYITADGDTNAMKKVQEEIKMSIIGIILIVTAYAITAVLSLAIFGDAQFILNPTIEGPVRGTP
jgi:heme/copper-type cytochrome/quinol oxidase subunit 2